MPPDGDIGISHRLDTRIKDELNAPGAFIGDITNCANREKTSDELVEMWNDEYPNDPVG